MIYINRFFRTLNFSLWEKVIYQFCTIKKNEIEQKTWTLHLWEGVSAFTAVFPNRSISREFLIEIVFSSRRLGVWNVLNFMVVYWMFCDGLIPWQGNVTFNLKNLFSKSRQSYFLPVVLFLTKVVLCFVVLLTLNIKDFIHELDSKATAYNTWDHSTVCTVAMLPTSCFWGFPTGFPA